MSTPSFGKPKVREPAPTRRRLLTPKDLPGKGINFSMNHVRRLIAAGKFPASIKLSTRRIAWQETVIDEWIDQRIAESEEAAA